MGSKSDETSLWYLCTGLHLVIVSLCCMCQPSSYISMTKTSFYQGNNSWVGLLNMLRWRIMTLGPQYDATGRLYFGKLTSFQHTCSKYHRIESAHNSIKPKNISFSHNPSFIQCKTMFAPSYLGCNIQFALTIDKPVEIQLGGGRMFPQAIRVSRKTRGKLSYVFATYSLSTFFGAIKIS